MVICTNTDILNKNLLFVFHDKNILVKKNSFDLPEIELFTKWKKIALISNSFYETEYNYLATKLITGGKIPDGFELIPLRDIFAQKCTFSTEAARSAGLLHWTTTTQFCCKCGHRLEYSTTETAKICSSCNHIEYPRIMPAVIVIIRKDDKILLAQHKKHINAMYACIAGYMELGETAEECVKRETFEETGLKVKNIHYFATQSWPFPYQLMIGFTADWESGTIRIQKEELLEAKWFSTNDLPSIPPPGSISYRLIKET